MGRTSPVTYIAHDRVAPFANGNNGTSAGSGSISQSPKTDIPVQARGHSASPGFVSGPRQPRNTSGISFKGLKHHFASRSMSQRNHRSPSSPSSPPFQAQTNGSMSPPQLQLQLQGEAMGLYNSSPDQSSRFASLTSSSPQAPIDPVEAGRREINLNSIYGSVSELPGKDTPADSITASNAKLSTQDFLANLSPAMNDFTMTEVPSPPTHTFSPYSQRIHSSSTSAPAPAAASTSALGSYSPNVGDASFTGGAKGVASKFFGINGGFTFGKKASLPSLRSQTQPLPPGQMATTPVVAAHMSNRSVSGPAGPKWKVSCPRN